MSSPSKFGSALGQPFAEIFSPPVVADRAPTTTDINYQVGQQWIYKGVASYNLLSVAAGAANWAIAGSNGDLDALAGDSGTATPTAGSITLSGGDNITTAGSGSTITFDLDAAIDVATSLTVPLIIGNASGDLNVQLGDTAGAKVLAIKDSASVTQASINSDGGIVAVNLATSGVTQTIGSSNSVTTVAIGSGTGGNTIGVGTGINGSAQIINLATGASGANSTVNILTGNGSAGTQTLNALTGTRAGALNLATGAAAHVVAIGSSSAGAITVDTAAGISLDAATVSNFTVTGAGQDLNLLAVGGSVLVDSTENAALAIRLHANGGTSETIQIHADQGTGVASVGLLSDVGGITLRATGLASADAINLEAPAGGIDIDSALTTNITSSQAAATAIALTASDAAGGITLTAGTGAVNVAGNLNLTSVATKITLNGGASTDHIGSGTLTAGTVTIANTNIASTDRIFIQRTAANASTTLGELSYTISAGASFTVDSLILGTPGSVQTGDLSSFVYIIFGQS